MDSYEKELRDKMRARGFSDRHIEDAMRDIKFLALGDENDTERRKLHNKYYN